MEKINNDLERHYQSRYNSMLRYSNDYKDLRPFGLLMKEFGGWGEDAIPCCLRLQDDLYNRGLLPFKVEKEDDCFKFQSLAPVVKDILLHVWIVMYVKNKKDK